MPFLDVTPAANPLLIRDFQTRITPNETQRNTLIVAGVYIIVIAILWLCFFFLQNFAGTNQKYNSEGMFHTLRISVSSCIFRYKRPLALTCLNQ